MITVFIVERNVPFFPKAALPPNIDVCSVFGVVFGGAEPKSQPVAGLVSILVVGAVIMGSANTDSLDSVGFVPKMLDVVVVEVLPNNADPNENPFDAVLSLSKANENELATHTGTAVTESVFSSFLMGATEEPPKIDVGVDVWLFPNIDCSGIVAAGEFAGGPNTNWLNMP